MLHPHMIPLSVKLWTFHGRVIRLPAKFQQLKHFEMHQHSICCDALRSQNDSNKWLTSERFLYDGHYDLSIAGLIEHQRIRQIE